MKIRALFLGVVLSAFAIGSAPAASAAGQADASDTRAAFLKLIDRPRVALDAEVQAITLPGEAVAGETAFHFTYATEAGQRVPGILVKTVAGAPRRPVVIALHGTGGSKMDEVALLRNLAAQGFIGVAIDGRYHGERAAGAEKMEGLNAYETAIVRTWRAGGEQGGGQKEHPLFYDTVWDVQRLMDYLETREDVDPRRMGVYGVSKGGIETYLAAAVDTRVAVAVPCIAVQSFQWGAEHNEWQGRVGTFQKSFNVIVKEAGANVDGAFVKAFYERVMPGIDSQFDGPAIVPLIAPRPLLMINSDNDDHTPITGMKESAAAVEIAYGAAGVKEDFVLRIQPGAGHKVTADSEKAAVEWFVKWLKPGM